MGNNMKFDTLSKYFEKPKLFAESTSSFWGDPHISKQILKAQLDPNWSAVSGKHMTIDNSINWITKKLNLQKGNTVLNLQSGPGLYSVRFSRNGLRVIGIDYSKRSIRYATEYARQNNLHIEYVCGDCLTIDYRESFDLITLIYCDFGVLADKYRDLLLRKISTSLKPGGFFVFDVDTPHHHNSITESKSWSFQKTGFWRPAQHLVLSEALKYPKTDVLLNQYTIIDSNYSLGVYRIWDHAYSIKSISRLLDKNDFADLEFYGDLAGEEYREDSKTLGIIARRSPGNSV